MARLLSLLLLYQAGYEAGRFISLELIVEETKYGYYDSLYQSSQGWHDTKHSLLPWWEYFLGVMLLTAYRQFESRMGILTTFRGAKTGMILNAIRDFRGEFTVRDLQHCCPTVGIDQLRKVLKVERTAKRIVRIGFGRDARWRKTTR
jgi:Fic family protein